MKSISKKDFEDIKKQIENYSLKPTNYYFSSFERQEVENGKIYIVIFTLTDETWYLNGLIHRESGPAFISTIHNKCKYYLCDEEISKEDFPKKLKLLAFW